MKKTMFITSVIMVVVLAIALTTSSLAWFSAGGATSVVINDFTVQAKVADLATGLEISLANSAENVYTAAGGWKSTSIDLSDGTNAEPMCPYKAENFTVSEGKVDIGELYAAISASMKTNKTAFVDSVSKFTESMASASAYKATFALRNQGQTAVTIGPNELDKITITLTQIANHPAANETKEITGHEANLWVAIFEIFVDGTGAKTAAEPTLVALQEIYSSGSNNMTYAYGTQMSQNSLASDMSSLAYSTFTISDVSLEAGAYNSSAQWEAGTPHFFELYAWYDGGTLTNANDYTKVQVGVTIGH